ncbi:MAG: thioredoxin family protein [Christensenellales bacterium]
MALFNFGKKKEEEKKALTCCCGSTDTQAVETAGGCCCSAPEENESASCCCGAPVDGICCIKVLGAGCKSCHEQYENATAAVKALGLPVEVEYITDMEKVMGYGVMSMPAIVVNDKVVSMGKVLKAADVEKLLHKLGY